MKLSLNRTTFKRFLGVLVITVMIVLLFVCLLIEGNSRSIPADASTDILQWQEINQDGSLKDTTIPIVANDTGRIAIQSTLPQIQEGQSLMIKINFAELTVKIDGQTVYSAGTVNFGTIHTQVGNYIAFVPLKTSDSGKSVQIDVTARDSRFRAALKHTTVLHTSDFLIAQARKFHVNLIVGTLYSLLGILMLCLWIIITLRHVQTGKHSKAVFVYGSVFLIALGAWQISDVHLAGIAFNQLTASGLVNYISFTLLPIGCLGLTYCLYTQSDAVKHLLLLMQLNFVAQSALFLLGLQDFPKMLPLTQILSIIAVFTFVIAATIDLLHSPALGKTVSVGVAVTVGIVFTISIVLYILDQSIFSWTTIASIVLGTWVMIKLLILTYQMIRDGIMLDEMKIHAYTDELTGLCNRRAYAEDVEQIQNLAPVNYLIIGQMDVNGLKETNDQFGHLAGDELLKAVSACIQKSFGSFGKCYRMGGDEFSVLALTDIKSYKTAEAAFQESLEQWEGEFISSPSVSIGRACQLEHPGVSIAELEKIADSDMYEAKQAYYSQAKKNRRKQRC